MKWLLSLGMLCFICMVMSAAVVGVSTSSVFQIPVRQPHEGNRIKAAKEGRLAEFKQNHNAHLLHRLTGKSTTPINAISQQQADAATNNANTTSLGVAAPVTDYYDLYYTGIISIGIGRLGKTQRFVVQFDTGSARLWIPDVTCGTGDSHLTKEQCQRKRRFNSSLSTTYKQDGTEFSIEYGTGFAKGFQGIDTVRIRAAGGPHLVIPDATFGQANDMGEINIRLAFDGILGLGLGNQDIVDWVQLDSGSLGWIFTVDAVKVGNKTVTASRTGGFHITTALSDTGSSLIVGPLNYVRAIARQVGAKKSRKYGLYVVKCNATYDPVTFVINNRHYNLTSAVLTLNYNLPDNWCLFAMDSMGANTFHADWILGDPFIRAYCNTYDMGNRRIGLAPTLAITHDDDYYDDNI